jgi:hypothetical protein
MKKYYSEKSSLNIRQVHEDEKSLKGWHDKKVLVEATPLVLAAPEMLEALESAINCLYAIRDHERENYGPLMGKVENALINKIIPVIAKARGES